MKEWSLRMEDDRAAYQQRRLAYSVGALLYTPASSRKAIRAVLNRNWDAGCSVCFCCEDSIPESALRQAEALLAETFAHLSQRPGDTVGQPPLWFIRVRNPAHTARVSALLGKHAAPLTGFVFPKFTLDNCGAYFDALQAAGQAAGKPLYCMPTLEDAALADPALRGAYLNQLKTQCDRYGPLILNIRVGGNDLCHLFGVRRRVEETIYDIGPIAHILSDIVSVFGRDYLVSAPVWEYFGGPEGGWKAGLRRELRRDTLNGFTGKTVIHPNQLSVVREGMQVSREDYEDAKKIVDWDAHTATLVGSGALLQRMNEYNTHIRWACHTLMLSDIYGVQTP